MALTELDILEEFISSCDKCELKKTCTKPLSGYGFKGYPGKKDYETKLMFVMDAPDQEEIKYNEILETSWGYVIELWINYLGLSKNDYWITNIVKCALPDDKTPKKIDLDNCANEWLYKEIKYLSPWIILPIGRIASAFFLGTAFKNNITDYCGKFYLSSSEYLTKSIDKKKRMIYPLLHPTWFIKRNIQEKESMWGVQFTKLNIYLRKRLQQENT